MVHLRVWRGFPDVLFPLESPAEALAQPHLFAMPLLATALFFLVFLCFDLLGGVSSARKRFRISAPAMDGPEGFQRCIRAFMNQVEQMPLFLALMWSFCVFVNPEIGGIAGLIWVYCRTMYGFTYRKHSELSGKLVKWTMPAYLVLLFYAGGEIAAAITFMTGISWLISSAVGFGTVYAFYTAGVRYGKQLRYGDELGGVPQETKDK